MEIRQLKYFVGIAECGSFSEASRKFFLSQSAISQQIKLLEEELDTTLFIRDSRNVTLTDSGQILLPLAKDLLMQMNQCKEKISDIHNLLSGELNLGLTHSLAPSIRVPVVNFMRRYPQVQLNIYYKTIPELIAMLKNGTIDLAFGIKVDNLDDWVESSPVLSYQLSAILRDSHPLSDRKILTFKDLEKQSLILPEKGLRQHNAVEQYLSHEGRDLKIRAFINDPRSILDLLRSTNCVSILSKQVVENEKGLLAIDIEELKNPVTCYAHVRKGMYKKRSVDIFLRILDDSISFMKEWGH